jgi:predicted house-cleaning noncanonical NTP pyrophosphatase (MazG superfamily)
MAKWEVPNEYSRSPSDMVKEFMSVTAQVVDPDLYETLIEEEFFEWQEEIGETVADLKELADLVYVIYGYAEARGYDLDEALVRVHQNNVGRCIQSDGTVHRRADGKIIKNPDYPKVQLEDLI